MVCCQFITFFLHYSVLSFISFSVIESWQKGCVLVKYIPSKFFCSNFQNWLILDSNLKSSHNSCLGFRFPNLKLAKTAPNTNQNGSSCCYFDWHRKNFHFPSSRNKISENPISLSFGEDVNQIFGSYPRNRGMDLLIGCSRISRG